MEVLSLLSYSSIHKIHKKKEKKKKKHNHPTTNHQALNLCSMLLQNCCCFVVQFFIHERTNNPHPIQQQHKTSHLIYIPYVLYIFFYYQLFCLLRCYTDNVVEVVCFPINFSVIQFKKNTHRSLLLLKKMREKEGELFDGRIITTRVF